MEILKVYLEEQLLIKHEVIKHLILLKIQNMMDNKRDLASVVYILLYKKNSVGAVKHEIMQNNKLAEELHKPIIRRFEK